MILEARGFGGIFRGWVRAILVTGKNAVLLNRVPGRWIHCKNGLRRGGALSPYLFLFVADFLPRLVYGDTGEYRLLHPLVDDLPCPVIQYANDTLLVLHTDRAQVRRLRELLDIFLRATGLCINFH